MIDLKKMPQAEIERRRARAYDGRALVGLYAKRAAIVAANDAHGLAEIDAAIARIEDSADSGLERAESIACGTITL